METHYITIHRISGVFGLRDRNEFEILKNNAEGFGAYITTDIEKYLLHIKVIKTIGMMTAQLFVSNDEPVRISSQKERFAEIASSVKINQPVHDSVFLIIDIKLDVDQLELEHIVDFGDFKSGLRVFDNQPHAILASKVFRSAFAGVSLVLPEHTTDTAILIGNIAYAVDPESGIFIYSTDIVAHATATTMTELDEITCQNAANIAKNLVFSDELENVIRLLSVSSININNRLLSFLSAWTSLEVFIQHVFKHTYEPRIHDLFKAAAPSSSRLFINQMQRVMAGKYNIFDKFVVVASFLDNNNAENDIDLFKKLKEQRDGIAHAMKIDIEDLQGNQMRSLLRKYLRLYLNK